MFKIYQEKHKRTREIVSFLVTYKRRNFKVKLKAFKEMTLRHLAILYNYKELLHKEFSNNKNDTHNENFVVKQTTLALTNLYVAK